MAKDASVLVRVQEEQKDKWKTHAEEYDRYESLTQLVIQSVETQISEDNQQFTIEEEFGQLLESVESLKNRMSRVEELNEEIRDTQATSGELAEQIERTRTVLESEIQTNRMEYNDSN